MLENSDLSCCIRDPSAGTWPDKNLGGKITIGQEYKYFGVYTNVLGIFQIKVYQEEGMHVCGGVGRARCLLLPSTPLPQEYETESEKVSKIYLALPFKVT